MALNAIRERSEKQAKSSLIALLKRAQDIDAVLLSRFGPDDQPLAEITERFKALVTEETVVAGAPNLAMVELLQLVQNELGYGATHMWHIERWISLTVPPHEDGNNFGVDVQASVLKTVQDRSAMLAGYVSDLPSYYWQRATVFEKVGKTVVNKTSSTTKKHTKTSTSAAAPGDAAPPAALPAPPSAPGDAAAAAGDGEKEEEEKEILADVSETKVVTSKLVPDYCHYLVATDVKWWFTLRDALRQVQDSYLTVCDAMEKNMEKVARPKGSGGGGMAMY